jgi:hypothetical protein
MFVKPIDISELYTYDAGNDWVQKEIIDEIIMVAARTGDPMELSELDTISYELYRYKFGQCTVGKGESYYADTFPIAVCEQRVRRTDERYVQQGWYTEDGIEALLKLVPDDQGDRSAILRKSGQFLVMTKSMLGRIKEEQREACCKECCD